MKRYLTHALGLALIVAGLSADGQFAQFPNDATKFLSGANSWAVKVRADGMGTASSNALWTATWYLP